MKEKNEEKNVGNVQNLGGLRPLSLDWGSQIRPHPDGTELIPVPRADEGIGVPSDGRRGTHRNIPAPSPTGDPTSPSGKSNLHQQTPNPLLHLGWGGKTIGISYPSPPRCTFGMKQNPCWKMRPGEQRRLPGSPRERWKLFFLMFWTAWLSRGKKTWRREDRRGCGFSPLTDSQGWDELLLLLLLQGSACPHPLPCSRRRLG